ncbi:putative Tc5 transposase DNA-binding domain-containing protein 3 [Homarus americanus]|uniref:Putative Tc5 transposase DNA-binding domain-containing protein 3 n=1 Tax=Homarus americanus TaxID=6706 RepID=A0A8J5JQZ6_HOMAM|nr:putative Tc5 transposase DNA-binding domain-containing protein 3 [Homarus americanus]
MPPPRAPVPGPATQRQIKKRKMLTYAEKLEVVKQIDGGKKKRAKQGRRNMAVETRDLMDTAKQLYQKLARKWEVASPPAFNASKGWIENFKSRHQVRNVKISVGGRGGKAGRGFDETTEDDIRALLELVMPTAEDIMEEDRQAEEDRRNREDSPLAQPAAQPMSKVREIIELSERLKHLIEQHPLPAGDSESVSGIRSSALQPYVDQLNHHHNALRQRQITDFFRQQQQPPVLPQADFEGFQEDDELLEELVLGGDH